MLFKPKKYIRTTTRRTSVTRKRKRNRIMIRTWRAKEQKSLPATMLPDPPTQLQRKKRYRFT